MISLEFGGIEIVNHLSRKTSFICHKQPHVFSVGQSVFGSLTELISQPLVLSQS